MYVIKQLELHTSALNKNNDWEVCSATTCTSTNYSVALITFRDKTINSQAFSRIYYISANGSTFKDSVTLAANSNLYVESIDVSIATSGTTIGNCYYSKVVGPAFTSATAVDIMVIYAKKRH